MILKGPAYKPSQFRMTHADNRRGNNYMLDEEHSGDWRMARIDRIEQELVCQYINALPAGAAVADVPCGNGRMSQWVARRGNLSLIAMDFNSDMLAGMVHRGETSLMSRRAQADILNMPLADKSVDLLVNMRLMHHIPDRATQVAMFREIARVCRGTVITSFWTTHCWRYLRKRILGKRIRGFPVAPSHFQGVCEEAGLVVQRMVPARKWWEEQVNVVCRVVGRGTRDQ